MRAASRFAAIPGRIYRFGVMRSDAFRRRSLPGPSPATLSRCVATALPVRVASLACALVLLALGTGSLRGQERMVRTYDARDGLAAPTVFSLAQDVTGFLWIGTAGGLYRHDGNEMRRWARDSVRGRIQRLEAAGGDTLLVLEESGTLWRLRDRSARRVVLPTGRDARSGGTLPATVGVRDVATSGGSVAWAVTEDGRLWRRGPVEGWRRAGSEGLEDERVRRVFGRADGGVDVATDAAVWTVSSRGRARRLVDLARVVDVLWRPDGSRFLLTFWRAAYLLDDGGLRRIADVPGRGVDLVLRGDVLWIAYDRYLVRRSAGGELEVLGPERGIEGGGPLLVDHEGSLWMGTFSGLLQFPEPETVRWADAHGLPSAHTRFVARDGRTLWVSTWQGLGRIRQEGGRWSADTADVPTTRSQIALDGDGDLWLGGTRGLVEIRDGRTATTGLPGVGVIGAAERDEGGRLWLGVEGGVVRVDPTGFGRRAPGRIEPVRGLDIPDDALVSAVLLDTDGRLWASAEERICRTEAGREPGGADPGWRCRRVRDAVHFNALRETDTGSVWAASPNLGVLRLRDGTWEPLPGMAELPSRSVLNLVPSRSGGFWVLGHGILVRVRPAPAMPAGWEVVERITPWHGVPTTGGRDLHEDPDGTLWVATSRGVVRIPAGVRKAAPGAPRVALVEARVDGERIPIGAAPELPHERNRLELRFAALSYRAPTAVRYQVRLHPEGAWSDARTQPVVRWVDLGPGNYRAEVRASLDGERWSAPAAAFAFSVLPPWYLEPGWLAFFGVLLVGALLTLYRARVAHLLELERQRTRIAMDLHDELGAGLGSVGIQAGMLGRAGVPQEERRRLADEIGETAEELGTTLADIVWSLDPRASTLDDLAQRLEERGHRLFAGRETTFRVRFPASWPEGELPAPVRRNVLLVGQEALANAANHAEADAVEVDLAPVRRGEWRLTVRDDGRGFDPSEVDPREGMGLRSMRKRAEELGAELAWRTRSGGGAEVELVFRLTGAGGSEWTPGRRGAGVLGRWWSRLVARMNVLLRGR